MPATISSSIIGPLQQHAQFPDWWESREVSIPFLDNRPMRITFMDYVPEANPSFIQEADEALAYFLRLRATERNLLSELVYAYCLEILDQLDEPESEGELRQLTEPNEYLS